MRLTEHASPEEKLAPGEITGLRDRLGVSESSDRRGRGLFTVSDVAEAFGLSPGEVQVHLDGMRAERALHPAPVRRSPQVLMGILAIAMLATAWQIYRIRTPVSNEQRLVDRAREALKTLTPNPYPILHTIEMDTPIPDQLRIEIKGRLTDTHVVSTHPIEVVPHAGAADRLAQVFKDALMQARAFEAKAPLPSDPKIRKASARSKPFAYYIGGALMGTVPPAELAPQRIDAFARKAMADRVSFLWKGQQQALGFDTPLRKDVLKVRGAASYVKLTGVLVPPPGFLINVGGEDDNFTSIPIVLAPLDPVAVEREMKEALRLADDIVTPRGSSGSKPQARPPFETVEVKGPLRSMSLRFPASISPQFPTMADLYREVNRLIDHAAADAASQAREIDAGTQPSNPGTDKLK